MLIFVVVLVAVGIGVYFLAYQQGYKTGYKTGYDLGVDTGKAAAKTTPGQAVSNPLEEMPSTNPFEKAVNPFKDLYKNPFK